MDPSAVTGFVRVYVLLKEQCLPPCLSTRGFPHPGLDILGVTVRISSFVWLILYVGKVSLGVGNEFLDPRRTGHGASGLPRAGSSAIRPHALGLAFLFFFFF